MCCRADKGDITKLLDNIFVLATGKSDKNGAAKELEVLLIPLRGRILSLVKRFVFFPEAGK